MTTVIQKYYIPIVLVLGVIFMAILYLLSLQQSWHLNRSIGWGMDENRYSFYQNHAYFVMWVIVFPLTHWIIYKFKRTINETLEIFQICCVFLIVQDLINKNIPVFYLNILNWLIFVLAVLSSFKKEWNERDSDKNEGILDA